MKKYRIKNKVIFITFSNLKSPSNGESVNDKKFYNAIPLDYQKMAIYPNYSKNDFVSYIDFFDFIKKYLKVIFSLNIIIITRGIKLSIIPLILKRFIPKKIVINLGCSPLWLVERRAWESNPEYKLNKNFFEKMYHIIEPHIERYALRHADKFFVENIKAKKIIEIYGAVSKNITIIPYYVQDYFMIGANPKFEKQKDFFKLGYTGRFRGYDIIDPIIKALSILKSEGYRIKLFLIGDGPSKQRIERLVHSNDLIKNVEFLGFKPHKEVSELVDQFHCLVLPMLRNLCPSTIAIKILEAVMKGKIVITTDSGNNKTLFLNNMDLIIDNLTGELIASKLMLIINDYNKYRKIAESLSEYHKKYRTKQFFEKKLNYDLEKIKL